MECACRRGKGGAGGSQSGGKDTPLGGVKEGPTGAYTGPLPPGSAAAVQRKQPGRPPSSKFAGVTWLKRDDRWRAQIFHTSRVSLDLYLIPILMLGFTHGYELEFG